MQLTRKTGNTLEYYKLDESNNPIKVNSFAVPNHNTPIEVFRMKDELPLLMLFRNTDGYYINTDGSLTSASLPVYKEPGSSSSSTFFNYYPVDVNNDGLKELLCRKSIPKAEFTTAYVPGRDGNLVPDQFNVVTWNEYNNLRSELTLSKGGDGIPGMGDMFGYDIPASTYGDFRTLDINGDGLSDMIDGTSGRYYLNTGMDYFVSNNFGGLVVPRDLNNDGIADFLVFDQDSYTLKLMKSESAGGTSEQILLSGLYRNYKNGIWCYDFDKDGDVDILVPIDRKVGRYDNGASILLYFDNDGKGNFTRYENWLDGTLNFFDCLDFDGDGKYEIVALNESDTSSRAGNYDYGFFDLRFYEITGKEIADNPEIFYHSKKQYTYGVLEFLPVNLDSSGIMTLTMGEYYDFFVVYTSGQPGTRPTPPGKPEYLYEEHSGQLKLFWEAALDAECSPVDLTYEIRVGTAPGLDDVVAVDAVADGRRRNLSQGANGHQLYHTFNVKSWPAGKYYISVQAVDPNMLGSEFSEYAVFEKKSPGADFTMDVPVNTSVGDNIKLKLSTRLQSDDIVSWSLDGAEILSSTERGDELTVKFTTHGEKRLKVAVAGGSGISSASQERFIDIYPAKVDSVNSMNPMYSIDMTFDLDADGRDEYITRMAKRIMEQNEEGEVSMIKKLYNTNLPLIESNCYFKPVDVNKDGLIDILNIGGGYNNEFSVWINNGNKDLVIGDKFSLFTSGQYHWSAIYEDFNNDGSLEGILSDCSQYFMLSNDCRSYQAYTMNISLPATLKSVYDFDGDGLLDLYVMIRTKSGSGNPDTPVVYYNNGDMTFRQGEQLPVNKESVSPTLIGDFDGDGTADLLYNGATSYFGISFYVETIDIYYGNGRKVEILCPDGNPFFDYTQSFDFDNNGIQDFLVQLSDLSYVIVYMFPDYTYIIADAGNGIVTTPVFNRKNGITYTCNLQILNNDNEAPTAPTALRHTVNNKFVNIAWNSATDKETLSNSLRYNISVKHKNASGVGAYVLSPMNQDKDGVSSPYNHRLLVQPRISIPISSIPAGEYEVRVQAVDNHNLAGSFSQVYYMTVPEMAELDAPTSAIVDRPISITFIGNQSQPSIDFGNDSEYKLSGKNYEVIWHSEGLKTITVGGREVATLMVYNAPEADFELPAEILEGATVNVTCATAKNGDWYIVDNGNEALLSDSPRVKGLTVTDTGLTFAVTGEADFIVRHTVYESYGSNVADHECKVNTINAKPVIDYVGVDSEGKHNEIHWDVNSLPLHAETINVYRETSRINEYELIGTAAAADAKVIDATSTPDIKAERYVIAVSLPYGESAKSDNHQTMLLQLNHGLGNSINLRWSKYEGRQVTSYQIYGGDNPESLQLIESLSGNMSSYIDKTPRNYYAVAVIFDWPSESTMKTLRKSKSVDNCMSNVVASADASNVLFAQGLDLYIADGNGILDLDESRTLKISATLSPAGVSINRLNWEITEGKDIATIDESGLVTIFKAGNVGVTARTCDGSELMSSIAFKAIGGDIMVESIVISPEAISGVVDETYSIEAKVLPENATYKDLIWSIDNTEVATILDNTKVRLLKVGTATISATATDGSGVCAICSVTVNDNSGIGDVINDMDTNVKIYNTAGLMIFDGKYNEANLQEGIYIIVTKDKHYKHIINRNKQN